MGQRATPPVRISAKQAAWEFHVNGARVRRGLKQLGIVPGKDQKYSLYEITQALYSHNGLEQKAKEAKWRAQIAEAKFKELRVDRESGNLIPTDRLRREWGDAVVTLFTRIRHDPDLSEQKKRQLIAGIETDFEKRFK